MRFLVTAGNTREAIDDVRTWSNIFTGSTGLAIARSLTALGDVDLLTSNAAHIQELRAAASSIAPSPFGSHAELKGALATLMARQKYDAVFMTAAVADYRPVRTFAVLRREPAENGEERWTVRDVQAGKVKSSHRQIAVLGERTEKLVDLFRTAWDHRGLLVKFKLEVGLTPQQLIEVGQASRRASGAEYLFANTLAMTAGPEAGAYLLSEAGEEWVPRAKLADRAAALIC
jgi:phosphopantothenoylcysteine synthetase/decarboxylase